MRSVSKQTFPPPEGEYSVKEKEKMIRMKAMVLVATFSLSMMLSLVSATSSRVAVGSRTSPGVVASSAVQAGAHSQSVAAERQTVGGEPTCAGLAGLAAGLAISAVIGCGPICLGLALGVLVVAAGCPGVERT